MNVLNKSCNDAKIVVASNSTVLKLYSVSTDGVLQYINCWLTHRDSSQLYKHTHVHTHICVCMCVCMNTYTYIHNKIIKISV